MKKVSQEAQQLFYDLLAWEVFGIELDPKALLRQASHADLAIVSANALHIASEGTHLPTVALQLVGYELLYREGKLSDWALAGASCREDGTPVLHVSLALVRPAEFIQLDFHHTEPTTGTFQ